MDMYIAIKFINLNLQISVKIRTLTFRIFGIVYIDLAAHRDIPRGTSTFHTPLSERFVSIADSKESKHEHQSRTFPLNYGKCYIGNL